jgi:hypothetical protein
MDNTQNSEKSNTIEHILINNETANKSYILSFYPTVDRFY